AQSANTQGHSQRCRKRNERMHQVHPRSQRIRWIVDASHATFEAVHRLVELWQVDQAQRRDGRDDRAHRYAAIESRRDCHGRHLQVILMRRVHRPRSSRVLLLLAVWICLPSWSADSPLPTTAAEIDSVARRVAGAGDSIARTQRLVSWMNSRLQWVATDYESRTPEQILARGAGNC